MASTKRRLGVIVCAEIVSDRASPLSDELAASTALKGHCAAVEPLFAEDGGRVIKTAGDGLLLEFPSAFHAVRAALAVQRLMSERNAQTPEDRRLVFRIGIHLGNIIDDDDGISGDGIDVAIGLQEIADRGGICLSQAVYANIRNTIDAPFRDGGSAALKTVNAPVHVYYFALDGSTAPPPSRPAAPPPASPSQADNAPQPAPPDGRVATRPAPGPRPAVTPAAPPAHRRPPFVVRLPVKLAVVAIAGVAAVAILEPERGWAIEVVSWMLIAAGAVQLVAAMIARPRP